MTKWVREDAVLAMLSYPHLACELTQSPQASQPPLIYPGEALVHFEVLLGQGSWFPLKQTQVQWGEQSQRRMA